MYTSVMLVAMLSPGAPPVVTSAPVRQVYHAMPGQVIYIIPSAPTAGIVSPGTVVYSQPVYVSNGSNVTSTYSNPVVIRSGAVIQSSTPAYSGTIYSPVSTGVVSSPMRVNYSPASFGAVCNT
jgi:hypothetical protein